MSFEGEAWLPGDMLNTFQNVCHKPWLEHNFPQQQPHDALLGLVEEVGELAHAHLKMEQGIRGMDDEIRFRTDAYDAIGDILIYLASYCNTNGFEMDTALYRAWEEVRKRDWQERPTTG